MENQSITGISLVEEDKAEGDVAELYNRLKRDFQFPAVPNMVKTIAVSPRALNIHLGFLGAYFENSIIPMSLFSMICFTIAEHSDCEYCAASNEVNCRTLGVDEATLASLAADLGNVNPERIRAIIEFALKAATYPLTLVAEDYQRIRDFGVTNEEIVEIIQIAALAVYSDIMADALKVSVDETIREALPHRY